MITILPITEDEVAMYQPLYEQHTPVGWMKDENITRLIVKMKPGYKGWTPSGCARDCGKHYIVARYASYDRIDKRTLTVIKDVEDSEYTHKEACQRLKEYKENCGDKCEVRLEKHREKIEEVS